MDIHKPKPVHNWRELLSELGVVVVGIVIALSGEQIVEAIHRGNERHELQESLQRESREQVKDAGDLLRASDAYVAWYSHIKEQIQQALATHSAMQPPPPWAIPVADFPVDSTFTAATASGRLALLPQSEVAAYSEAHVLVGLLWKTEEATYPLNAEQALFQLKFRQADASMDLAKASEADLRAYDHILSRRLIALAGERAFAQQLVGLAGALARGERDLRTLQRAERSAMTPVKALDIKFTGAAPGDGKAAP